MTLNGNICFGLHKRFDEDPLVLEVATRVAGSLGQSVGKMVNQAETARTARTEFAPFCREPGSVEAIGWEGRQAMLARLTAKLSHLASQAQDSDFRLLPSRSR